MKGIAWQVLWALHIMHGEECIHGDIKLNVRTCHWEKEYTVKVLILTIYS